MRGDPHSYQAIAHEDPGYNEGQEMCEICDEEPTWEHYADIDKWVCDACAGDMTDDEYEGLKKEAAR